MGDGGSEGTVGQKGKDSEEKRRGQRHEMVKKASHAWEFSNRIFFVRLLIQGTIFVLFYLMKTEFLQDN